MTIIIKNNTKIAVLLATYNGEKYISEQIESLLNQTYRDFTCYIHDDGSTDQTNSIIYDYSNQYPDKIVILQGPSRGGAKENFIYMLNVVEAEYYMFCDQDDVWEPTKIEDSIHQIEMFEQRKPACVYTDLIVVDENLQLIDESFYHFTGLDPTNNIYKEFIIGNVCVGCTMIINRSLRDDLTSIDCLVFQMHDKEAAMIAALKGNLYYLDKKTIQYRQHQTNSIGAAEKKPEYIRLVNEFSEYKRHRKENLAMHRARARELLKLDGISSDKKAFLMELASIDRVSKIQRMKFYYGNGLFRSCCNKMGQIIRVLGV